MLPSKLNLREMIEQKARELGFDLAGFSSVKLDSKYVKKYRQWLAQKYEGKMFYMKKIFPRQNLDKILPGACTVISLATNYYHEQKPLKEDEGRIARYAFGRDYHKIIGKKLKELEKFVVEISTQKSTKSTKSPEPTKDANSEIVARSYVDTGPILERAFAETAGIGQIGKNSCLITKEFGSWVFLSEIITSLDLCESSAPSGNSSLAQNNFSICGTCTKCMNACPTGAIVAPGLIDARKCLSYITIEHKGKIPQKIHTSLQKEKRLFGCDICQEVCPHNCRAKKTMHEEFQNPVIAGDSQNLSKIIAIKSDEEFLETFAGSPLMRAKKKGLQKIAKIIETA